MASPRRVKAVDPGWAPVVHMGQGQDHQVEGQGHLDEGQDRLCEGQTHRYEGQPHHTEGPDWMTILTPQPKQ